MTAKRSAQASKTSEEKEGKDAEDPVREKGQMGGASRGGDNRDERTRVQRQNWGGEMPRRLFSKKVPGFEIT